MGKVIDFRVAKFLRFDTNGLRTEDTVNRNIEPFKMEFTVNFDYDQVPTVFVPEPTQEDIEWLINDEKIDYDE